MTTTVEMPGGTHWKTGGAFGDVTSQVPFLLLRTPKKPPNQPFPSHLHTFSSFGGTSCSSQECPQSTVQQQQLLKQPNIRSRSLQSLSLWVQPGMWNFGEEPTLHLSVTIYPVSFQSLPVPWIIRKLVLCPTVLGLILEQL